MMKKRKEMKIEWKSGAKLIVANAQYELKMNARIKFVATTHKGADIICGQE